jgi:hypothetical protein
MGEPLWKSEPTWFLVATNDEAIPPDAERQFAHRMGATTIEVASSDVAMVSKPAQVVQLIEKAVAGAPAAHRDGAVTADHRRGASRDPRAAPHCDEVALSNQCGFRRFAEPRLAIRQRQGCRTRSLLKALAVVVAAEHV